jgi:tubulin-specific chaperone D
VIVRFFSTETRHLELLLSAIEKGGQQEDGQSANLEAADSWEWEERYIVLLWLSQLLLAPFDLATISSEDTDDIAQPSIPGLSWPPNTPGLTIRVIPLALRYLSSSGKERDAAKILLGRIAMRKDMQELGILNALVKWAIFSLQSSQVGHSTYYYIGILSFLAGILVSSEGTTDMNPYLEQISRLIQNISSREEPVFKAIRSSAVARRTILKALRTVTVLLIHNPDSMPDSDAAIEATIDHLLDSLADPSTPVRLAASKALSVITLKLPEDMAVQVGAAVLENLNKNILYVQKQGQKGKTRDLSRVNPFEWHGLVLTMAHLLYRRSIPLAQLPPIVNALRLGLVFEQRSTSGSSVGTNVRDAACFGIWATARRYATHELQKLKLKDDIFAQGGPIKESPILQTLATELVVSASLDPAGNIRRGSSAALQELIGRHPNTIAEGINVVQVVDYHAVALRSRAVGEVALQAAKLSDQYYQGLLNALLGWRGILDGDAAARRVAADAIGKLVSTKYMTSGAWKGVGNALDLVGERLQQLAAREDQERHGLMLTLAAIVENFNRECTKDRITSLLESGLEYDRRFDKSLVPQGLTLYVHASSDHGNCDIGFIVRTALSYVSWAVQDANTHWSSYRKLDLVTESCSRLIIALCPLLRADCVFRQNESLSVQATEIRDRFELLRHTPKLAEVSLLSVFENPSFSSNVQDLDLAMALDFVDFAHVVKSPPDTEILNPAISLVDNILDANVIDSAEVASIAAADLLLLVGNVDHERSDLIWQYNTRAGVYSKRGGTNQSKSYIHTLFRIFPLMDQKATLAQTEGTYVHPTIADLISTLRIRWSEVHEIETRATILNCLANSSALHTHTSNFISMISEGLDDYTTNAQGDVGSLVRIEATKAAGALWANLVLDEAKLDAFQKLFGKVLRAAAEKLDRVRIEGQKAVASALHERPVDILLTDPTLPATNEVIKAIAEDTENFQNEAKESCVNTASKFKTASTSSKDYFRFLLDLQTHDWLAHRPPFQVGSGDWSREFMEGYITSADTGAENLVRASRAALAEFCEEGYTAIIFDALMRILETQLRHDPAPNEDRVVVPCLEVLGFLFDARFLQSMNFEKLRYRYA